MVRPSSGAALPLITAGLVRDFRPGVGMFQDSALTTPATANGDPLGGWVDQAAGVNLLQATSGNRPTIATGVSEFNGATVARGATAGHLLDSATNSGLSGLPKTIFLVCKKRTAASSTTAYVFNFDVGSGGAFLGTNSSSWANHWIYWSTTGGVVKDFGVDATTAAIICLRFNGSGDADFFWNGAAKQNFAPELNVNSASNFHLLKDEGVAGSYDVAQLLAHDSSKTFSDADAAQQIAALNALYAVF